MSKPRIAILADVPLGMLAGIEGFAKPTSHYATWLEALIPAFENVDDLDLHWITFSKEVRKITTRRALGQDFTILPRYKKLLSMVTAYCWETWKVARLLKEIAPDVIHAWGCEDVYGLAGARASHPAKLFTLQGCLSECLKNEPYPKTLMKLQASFERKTIRAFSNGIGESEISTGHLTRIHPEMKTEVIDYGVDRDFFDADWNPSEKPTVLFAGTVCGPKGIVELVEVMRKPEFAGVTLEIAGEGSLLEELKGKEISNVKCLGRLSRPVLVKAMERAWVLAIPTYADTGPSIVKEARVLGLPVVTTDAAGASHYISDSEAGRVIPVGEVESLAEALKEVTASREACIEIGRKGWSEHREVFRPTSAALKFADLYRALVR